MSKINLHEMMKKRMNELSEASVDRNMYELHEADARVYQFKAGYTAALNDLQGKVDVLVEAAILCDKWFQEIYPADIFIGGNNADDGVNRVVEMRELTKKAISGFYNKGIKRNA